MTIRTTRKPLLFRQFWLVVISIALTEAIYAQDNTCNALLTHSLYDVFEASSQEIEQHRVYDYVCRESRERVVQGQTRGISAGYKLFSLGARQRLATVKEYYDTYCHESYDERFEQTSNYIRIKKINENVLRSWNVCMESANRGVEIVANIKADETSVRFQLKRTTGDGHTLRSIDSDIFQCRSGEAVIDRTGLTGTSIELSGDAFNFTCRREGQHSELFSTIRYASGDLVLDLSTGQFVIDFQERIVGPMVDRLAALETQVSLLLEKQLEPRVGIIEDQLAKAVIRQEKWTNETVVKGYGDGAHIFTTKSVMCPDGTYVGGINVRYRGTCNLQCNPDGGIIGDIEIVCKPL